MNVQDKISKISGNIAVRGAAIVAIGSLIGSSFSYLLHFALGKMISVEEYGLFSAMLSLGVILNILAGGFLTSFIKIVTEIKSSQRFDVLTNLFFKLLLFISCVAVTVILFVYVSRVYLAEYLNTSNYSVFLAFGFYLGFNLYLMLPSAFLQGLLRYKAFAFFNIFSGISRFLFPVVLVYLGYSVGGIYYGFAIGFVVTLIMSLFLLRKNFEKSKEEKIDLTPHFKKILSLSVATIFLNAGTSLLVNTDVVLAKHFLDSASAGIYSSAVTVGKILLFGSSSITLVMFPQIASAYVEGKDYVKRFQEFFIIQIFVTVAGILFFSIFSGIIVKIMFNINFLPAVKYVPGYALFMGLYILMNFMMMFFLAIDKNKIFLTLIPAVVGQLVLIELFHNSITQIININIVISAILLLVTFLYYVTNVGINNRSGL